MQTFNIGRDNSDPSFRYKMPPPVVRMEGRNTSVVTNLKLLARKLGRPADYLTTFWSIELRKKNEIIGDCAHIRGRHSAQTLLYVLNKFISKYVLCPQPKCRLPETDLIIEGDCVLHDCRACGHSAPLNMDFKMSQYILQHPMPIKKQKSACDMRRIDVDEFVFPSTASEQDEDDWAVDPSEEAAKERAATMANSNCISPVEANEQQLVTDTMKKLTAFITDDSHTVDDVIGFVKHFITDATLRDAAPGVIFEALVRPADMLSDVRKYASVIAFVTENSNAAQKLLLGCMERHCAAAENAMPQVAHVLMCLYQADALSEEAILRWHARPRRTFVSKHIAQQVQAAAIPFIQWLKTAEEADDD